MNTGLLARIQQWLGAESSSSEVPDETIIDYKPEQGLAARLHLLCLQALQYLYKRERDYTRPGSQAENLKKEVGRLYLWGESFEAGDLDKALEQSDGLRDIILGLLSTLGGTLVRGKNRNTLKSINGFWSDFIYMGEGADETAQSHGDPSRGRSPLVIKSPSIF